MSNQSVFTFLKEKRKYKRKHNTRYINEKYIYSIEDVSIMLKVDKRTISRWISKGLHIESKSKPYLIKGIDLKSFLDKQNNQDKIITQPYEVACLKCRSSSKPLNNQIEIHLHNTKIIFIKAKCNKCKVSINKAQNINMIYKWVSIYEVLNKKQIEALLRLYSNNNTISRDMNHE